MITYTVLATVLVCFFHNFLRHDKSGIERSKIHDIVAVETFLFGRNFIENYLSNITWNSILREIVIVMFRLFLKAHFILQKNYTYVLYNMLFHCYENWTKNIL